MDTITGEHLKRSYKVYTGPHGQKAYSRDQAWRYSQQLQSRDNTPGSTSLISKQLQSRANTPNSTPLIGYTGAEGDTGSDSGDDDTLAESAAANPAPDATARSPATLMLSLPSNRTRAALAVASAPRM